MAGDLNAKRTDWNSKLNRARGSLLRHYANRNSCLISRPDYSATALYTHNATPDVPRAQVKRVPIPSPPLQVPGGLFLSDSDKADAMADRLESQFQLMDDLSDMTVIEIFTEAISTYEYAPASEPTLTNLSEIT
jgi:hypothetical protein